MADMLSPRRSFQEAKVTLRPHLREGRDWPRVILLIGIGVKTEPMGWQDDSSGTSCQVR